MIILFYHKIGNLSRCNIFYVIMDIINVIMKNIEKIFNPWTLLALNAVIIFAAELAGGGEFFMETGLIHAIAIAFILLSVSRVYTHYHTFDAFLERLVHAALAAMTVFSFSHVAEFLSYMVFHLKEDAVFVNVANFYIASMLFIGLGAEYFIRTHNHKNRWAAYVIGFFILLALALIPIFMLRDDLPSLEPGEPMFAIYFVAVLAITTFTIIKLLNIRRLVSMTREFINYLIAAIALIGLSAIQNVAYDVLEELGMPDRQIMYTSHFAFYGALSLMFLAFVRLANLPGIYSALQKEKLPPPAVPPIPLAKKKSIRTKKSANPTLPPLN